MSALSSHRAQWLLLQSQRISILYLCTMTTWLEWHCSQMTTAPRVMSGVYIYIYMQLRHEWCRGCAHVHQTCGSQCIQMPAHVCLHHPSVGLLFYPQTTSLAVRSFTAVKRSNLYIECHIFVRSSRLHWLIVVVSRPIAARNCWHEFEERCEDSSALRSPLFGAADAGQSQFGYWAKGRYGTLQPIPVTCFSGCAITQFTGDSDWCSVVSFLGMGMTQYYQWFQQCSHLLLPVAFSHCSDSTCTVSWSNLSDGQMLRPDCAVVADFVLQEASTLLHKWCSYSISSQNWQSALLSSWASIIL